MKVILYTTLGCHLCEEAHGMLNWLKSEGMALEIEPVEIADDETLMERYGIRIPVVQYGEDEIGWPFTIEELKAFLPTS